VAAAAAARAAPGMRLSRWRRTWIHFLRRPTTGDTMKKFSVLRTPAPHPSTAAAAASHSAHDHTTHAANHAPYALWGGGSGQW
jgi:hypothetical protein